MSARELISRLASRGRYHFSTEQAARELGVSITAARAALRRLKDKGEIADPYRGFHVIVPPQYRRLGCLPAEQFIPQLMAHLHIPYYAGLLTAARYHGATHQQPQIFQVLVQKNRPSIRCGKVAVAFVGRNQADAIPTVSLNTPRGPVAVSAPEATAFDLVGYPRHAGGLSNVATVLVEISEHVDPAWLASRAPLSPIPWAQRLGYLLELVGKTELTEPLAGFVQNRVRETVPLSPAHDAGDAERDERWKLRVNVEVEPEL
jgi:predicted transcriptional regulator of viral defense system